MDANFNFLGQVTNVFIENLDSKNEEEKLQTLFQKDKNVRDAFLGWSKNHYNLVVHTPKLLSAYKIACANNKEKGIEAGLIRKIAALFSGIQNHAIQEILTTTEKYMSESELNAMFDLHALGILSSENLVKNLKIQWQMQNSLMHNSKMVDRYISIFDKFIPDQFELVKSFSVTLNSNDHIPIQYHNIANGFLPLLDRLPVDQLVNLLSVKNSRGETVFHYKTMVNYSLIKILEKLIPDHVDQLISLLSIDSEEGMLSFMYRELANDYRDLFRKLLNADPVKFSKLINTVGRNGYTAFTDLETNKIYRPLMQECQNKISKQLNKLITLYELKSIPHEEFVKDFGVLISLCESIEYPLMNRYIQICEKLIPHDIDKLVSLLSIQNKNGYGLFMFNGMTNSNIMSKLISCNINEFSKLMSLTTKKGRTALSIPELEIYYSSVIKKEVIVTLDNHNSGIVSDKELIEKLTILFSLAGSKASVFDSEVIDRCVQIFDRFESDQIDLIKPFLTAKDSNGFTVLHYKSTIIKFMPFLEKFPPKHLSDVLSVKDNQGNTPLHYSSGNLLVPLLDKFLPAYADKLFNLLSIQNDKGYAPFLFTNTASIYSDLLIKLFNNNTDKFIKLMSIALRNGETALTDWTVGEEYLIFFATHIFSEFSKTLSTNDLAQKSAILFSLARAEIFNKILIDGIIPILGATPKGFDIFQPLLVAKNSDGWTSLHHPGIREKLLPFLRNLEVDQIIFLLSQKDKKGNTPLHKFKVRDLLQVLAGAIPDPKKLSLDQKNRLLDLFFEPNEKGEIPFEICNRELGVLQPLILQVLDEMKDHPANQLRKFSINPQWVSDVNKQQKIPPKMSYEEYALKAAELKKNINDLWSTFHFGAGEADVPFNYLSIGGKLYKAEQFKQALDTMVSRILTQESWLGTPSRDQPEQLHVFYSEMLHNFTTLLENLKETKASTNEIAATLLDIAAIEMKGYCAAHYQGGIDQAKQLSEVNLDQQIEEQDGGIDLTNIEEKFKKQANNILLEAVEDYVREANSTQSVHLFNQISFAVKLATSSDPYSDNRNIHKYVEKVLTKWDLGSVIRKFLNASKTFDKEQCLDWFMKHTPENFFGKQYSSDKFQKAQKGEDTAIKKAQEQLQNQGLSEESSQKIVKFFCGEEFSKVTDLEGKWGELLGEERYRQLIAANSEEAIDALSEEIPRQQRRAVVSDFKNQLKLKNTIESTYASSSVLTIPVEEILKIKKDFDESIDQLGLEIFSTENEEKLDPSAIYNRKHEGLPSQRLDRDRRIEYAKQFFVDTTETVDLTKRQEGRPWLTPIGAGEILTAIGVLNKTKT